MSTNYIVRSITPEDSDEITRLLEICLGKSDIPRTPEFWQWKHVRNPFGISSGLAAEQGGKIIGLRVLMRWMWGAAGRNFQAVRAVDTVTHPDWRSKGIFSRLTSTLLEEMRREGVSFVFNTPNQFSKPGYLKLGWKEVTRIPLLIRPLKPVRIAWNFLRKGEARVFKNEPSSIKQVLQSSDWESYLNNSYSGSRLHTIRTRDYLQWRYSEIPGFVYHARYRTENNSAALIIFRNRQRKGLQELSISELLVSHEGAKLGKDLLEETIQTSGADYAAAIAANKTVEQRLFRKSGFLPVGKRGPTLTVRQLQNLVPEINILDWNNWRCSIGDLELF